MPNVGSHSSAKRADRRVRVAVETQYAVGNSTGLGSYASRLYDALQRRRDVEVVALRDDRFDLWRFDRRVYWDQLRAPMLAKRARADIVHFTGGTVPLAAPHRTVVTVHDLVWLRGANRGRPYVRWYFGRLQPSLVRKAAAIVVDTAAARADVADGLRVSPDRILVAGAAADDAFYSIVRRMGDGAPFVLTVGTVEERKDLITAVRAIARIPDVRLVSVGPHTAYAEEVMREAALLGVTARVELRGYVDDAMLLQLYSKASALVSPSRYEGFGLPPLQAQAAGLPVVAARGAVVEEVLGAHAWYAPVGDFEAFAAQLDLVLRGGAEVDARVASARTHARAFSWDAVAERMSRIYQSVM
jgi:glycosyltransferase involved in cell wall biosynthesis